MLGKHVAIEAGLWDNGSTVIRGTFVMSKTGFYDTNAKCQFVEDLAVRFGPTVARSQVLELAAEKLFPIPYWFLNDKDRSVGRGRYSTSAPIAKNSRTLVKLSTQRKTERFARGLDPSMFANTQPEPDAAVAMIATVTPINRKHNVSAIVENLIPSKDPTYVEFGPFSRIAKIIDSKIFYPVFITGLSGNGKTLSIEQACAKLKRECIRVNVTEETDEDDLVGGNTLVDGSIVYREGPVLTAMRHGAVLILDEVDLNATKIMCLQSIMEGKPYHIKKTGEKVFPAVGFNIFATANTKGKGSDDGRFIGTKVMNEAFLERFPITFEQDYPPEKIELKILKGNMDKFNCMDEKFAANLVKWANVIRKSFADGATNEVISTRRLVHIVSAFAIFRNRLEAVELCLNRFDGETKASFLDLYTKVDAEVDLNASKAEAQPETQAVDEDIPF